MPDDVTTKDSAAGAATPQGTDAPQNDQSGAATGATGQKAAPEGFSEEFLKTLDTADPASLPQNYRQRVEAPFKADYTRKTQELAEERKRFEVEKQTLYDAYRKFSEKPQGPSPLEQRINELKELAVAGDGNALQELVRLEARQMVEPMQTQNNLRNACETARGYSPYVRDGWDDILNTIKNDPKLGRLWSMENHAFADTIMIGLGLEREVMDLRPKLAAAGEALKAAQAKIAALEKERVTGLPASTSKAGTTTGAPAPASLTDLTEIARQNWIASGGRPEDFR